MAKRIMLLGASIICVRYVQSLKAMGLEVFCVDRDAQAPALKFADQWRQVNISDPEACLKAAREVGVDGILAINDFGVYSAAYVAEHMGLPGIPLEVAEVAVNKYLMRKVWQEAGLNSVAHRRVHSAAQLREAMAELPCRLIVKPVNSQGGGCRGIRVVEPGDDPAKIYEYANAFYRDDDVLVEEFVEGMEHSVEVLVHHGESHVIAISDKVKSPLPYRVDHTILYPTVQEGENLAALEKTVKDSVTAVGIEDGVAHVELSMTDRGPVLFELGARCGGGAPDPLVPYLSGVEQLKEAARIALGESPTRLAPAHKNACVIRFWHPEPGRIVEISGVEQARTLPGVLSLMIFKERGDLATPIKVCGDRAGMVIAGGKSRQEALERADKVIETVIFETVPE